MIWRYVQLQFDPARVAEFVELYGRVGGAIGGQPGCLSLAVLRDTSDPATFATWSCWATARDLQDYRRSDFFRGFWPQVRAMLRAEPVAASYEVVSGSVPPLVDPG